MTIFRSRTHSISNTCLIMTHLFSPMPLPRIQESLDENNIEFKYSCSLLGASHDLVLIFLIKSSVCIIQIVGDNVLSQLRLWGLRVHSDKRELSSRKSSSVNQEI